jgi:hypothetical protein
MMDTYCGVHNFRLLYRPLNYANSYILKVSNIRMLSAIVETMTGAILCNPSAAVNACSIWRAASTGNGSRQREILGGLSTASLGFNRNFSTIDIGY